MKNIKKWYALRRKNKMSSVIHPLILFDIAVKNLRVKRMRSLLTILGIVIGVGSIVFLVSLAQGLQETVNNYVIGSKSVNAIDVTSPNTETIPLSIEKVEQIRNFANITEVEPTYVIPGKISNQGSLTDAVLYGTSDQYIKLSALSIVAGKGTIKQDKDVIVSASLLDLIGVANPKDAIGRKIIVETELTLSDGKMKEFTDEFSIAGVSNMGTGVAVYMNSKTFASAGVREYGQVKVVAKTQENVQVIRDQIAGLGLTTASPLDTLNEIKAIFTIFTGIVIGFGGIGVVIAILGMFNTLTISLLERTSEIGLMIAMGARKADVKRLMIIEALLLSCVGGAGGIAVAWLLGSFVNVGLTIFANERGVEGDIYVFVVTPALVLITMFFVFAVGYLVALYPARKAGKINPINELKKT